MSRRVFEAAGTGALEGIGPQLDDLLSAVGAPITARRWWLSQWVAAYGEWEPWVIGVTGPDGGSGLDGGGLDGVALLARHRRAGMLRVTGLAHGASDRSCALVTRSADAAAPLADAVAGALRSLRGPWTLTVEQLRPDEPAVAAVAERLATAAVAPGDGCPVLVVAESRRDPAAYLKKKTRRDIKTAYQRLSEAGLEASVERLTSPAAVLERLPAVVDLHQRRDHELGRPSDIDDPHRRRFYLGVVEGLAAAGAAELTIVWVNGEMASFDLSLVDGDTLHLFDGRIASAFARYGPGHLAHEALLGRVVGDPALRRMDWMRGEQPYKLHLANGVDPTVELRAWSSPVMRTMTRLPRQARTAFRGYRAKHPRFQAAYGAIRKHIR